MECHADQLKDNYEYLKVCTNVHSLQLGCFGVCDIEIPGTEHLIAKVDFALRTKLHIALIVCKTDPRGMCVREGGE